MFCSWCANPRLIIISFKWGKVWIPTTDCKDLLFHRFQFVLLTSFPLQSQNWATLMVKCAVAARPHSLPETLVRELQVAGQEEPCWYGLYPEPWSRRRLIRCIFLLLWSCNIAFWPNQQNPWLKLRKLCFFGCCSLSAIHSTRVYVCNYCNGFVPFMNHVNC